MTTVFALLENLHSDEQPDPRVAADSEVDIFLLTPITNTSQFALQYWAQKSHVFPKLGELARRFLAIPAANADVERLFSASGRIISNY